MRPLNLVITGFGTYCNRTEINLEQLGTQGLYLITGDTGSGKTTIFDAITYALYGEVNGNNRTVSMIRSTFATPDIPTLVELTFEYRGQIYYIKRNPEYERRALRGNSTTKQIAEAVLQKPDGSVVTGSSKVTEAINELLSLDITQFSQIVMIAQGEFQKLLMEGTKDRETIFRQIFKTELYQKLQMRLADEEKSLYGQCKDIQKALDIFIQGVSCDSTSELNVELEKALHGELAINDVQELISKIISEDEQKSKRLEQQIDEHDKQIKELNIAISKDDEMQKLQTDYEEKTKSFEAVKESIGTAKTAFENEKGREKDRTKKEAELTVLKEDLKKYEELNGLEEEIEECKNQFQTLEEKEKELNAKNKSQTEKKESFSNLLKELGDSEQKCFAITNEQKELSERKNGFDELEESVGTCEKLLQKFENLQSEYKTTAKTWEELDASYKTLRKTYMDEQAGIIAETLQDGVPCPVCGSLEHPKPASKSEVAPSKEELDAAEEKAKEWEQKVSSVNASCAKAKADYENTLKQIEEKYKKLTKASADKDLEQLKEKLSEYKRSAQEALEECNKRLESENARVTQKKKIEQELPELEKNLTQIQTQITETGSMRSAVQARLDEKSKQVQTAKAKLKYENSAEAQKVVDELEHQIEQMKLAFEETQKEYEKIQKAYTTLEGELNQLKKQLDSSEKIDVSELKEKLTALETEKKTALDQKGFVDTRIDKNSGALTNIKERSEALDGLEKQHAYVNALAKTANGNLSGGKEKIKLETYIQMTYFDRIIAHANKRLMIMSDLQYELVRKKEADSLKNQTGLELDVIDHYNGGQRSVKSLSGGESFQASLALALGLSDEVRLSAGGIKIDSMFIDEGFGTLDSETLQKAFKALSGITEGNRLIGIISHVDLLKEKIDRQIVVKKERTGGSTVKVMV